MSVTNVSFHTKTVGNLRKKDLINDLEIEAGNVGGKETCKKAAGGGHLYHGRRALPFMDFEDASEVGGLQWPSAGRPQEEEEKGEKREEEEGGSGRRRHGKWPADRQEEDFIKGLVQ